MGKKKPETANVSVPPEPPKFTVDGKQYVELVFPKAVCEYYDPCGIGMEDFTKQLTPSEARALARRLWVEAERISPTGVSVGGTGTYVNGPGITYQWVTV